MLDREVLTMSFAPKDEHEAQIQFALERGIPATLAIIGTQRLTFPDNAFDLIHCSRCRVHWHGDGKLHIIIGFSMNSNSNVEISFMFAICRWKTFIGAQQDSQTGRVFYMVCYTSLSG